MLPTPGVLLAQLCQQAGLGGFFFMLLADTVLVAELCSKALASDMDMFNPGASCGRAQMECFEDHKRPPLSSYLA